MGANVSNTSHLFAGQLLLYAFLVSSHFLLGISECLSISLCLLGSSFYRSSWAAHTVCMSPAREEHAVVRCAFVNIRMLGLHVFVSTL